MFLINIKNLLKERKGCNPLVHWMYAKAQEPTKNKNAKFNLADLQKHKD